MAKTKLKPDKQLKPAKPGHMAKSVETRAEEIMSSALVVIHPDANFREAVELLTQRKLTVLPVVNSENKLLGMLSEEDILASCESLEHLAPNFLEKKIRYQKEFQKILLTDSLDQVAVNLRKGPDRHVAVVDPQGFLKGMITRRDLIRVLYLRTELSQALHGNDQDVVLVI